jgi:large subunit ribosomal protein L17
MRHGRKDNHLGRKAGHRKALLANLAVSLITHKRIQTTVAKAKELRKYVEPLVTKSKVDSTHSRRMVFSYLNNKEAVSELFREVAGKISDRPGGYLRIIKLGNRQGDNAEMAMIEFVDYNANLLSDKAAKAPAKKRTRRAGTTKAKTETPAAEKSAESETATEE